ncbi:MAG TPA: capsular polysaccharide synthesis protein [Bacilli bacterium]|nr:capsular polysaccharide synthesis protein [Bacilli bacterium]
MKKFEHIKDLRMGFGTAFAFKCLTTRLMSKEKYNRLIYKRLCEDYSSIISLYKNKQNEKNIDENKKINVWIFWWQGVNSAPEIVKKCVDSIYRNFSPLSFNVFLITSENIKEYCDFPSYIYSKLASKKITLTHFSDLIRANLLSRHGGLWIDATVYVSSKVSLEPMRSLPFFTIKNQTKTNLIINNRWTGFLLYAPKGTILFKFLNDFFMDYWKKNSFLIDYLLVDFGIALAIENIPVCKDDYSRIPITNENINELLPLLNQPYSEDIWESLKSNTQFFKLSYKKEIVGSEFVYHVKNKKTFYGKIIDGELL